MDTIPLFDLEPQPPEGSCMFPNMGGSTGYRYGCRCPRCRAARVAPLSPRCAVDGCPHPRVKNYRLCAEHVAIRNGQRRSKGKWITADCEVCGKEHGWYESQLHKNYRPEILELIRRVCAHCRSSYMGAIRAHHLNADQAIRLITATACENCGGPFTHDGKGRRNALVDHDHACCANTSCGRCFRGIICHRCNHLAGILEDAGLDLVSITMRYVGWTGGGGRVPPTPPPPTPTNMPIIVGISRNGATH